MTAFERAQRYLEKVPGTIDGQGGCHSHLFKTAIAIVQGYNFTEETALQLLGDWNQKKCDPPWSQYDLRHKVRDALYASPPNRQRGYLLASPGDWLTPDLSRTTAFAARPRAPAPKPWPEPDLALIDRVVTDGITCYDLYEKSPIRFDDSKLSHTEEIIDAIFPGNPWLCCGLSPSHFATRRRESWRGYLSQLGHIVPNPLLTPWAQTASGHWSQRARAAVAAPVYLVLECDFPLSDSGPGRPTKWTPRITCWQENHGLSVLDANASILWHLARYLPLVLVVFSGHRSLHGWFRVFQIDQYHLYHSFMRPAVALGCDHHGWFREHPFRMPDGLRENGTQQRVLYFDPNQVVKP